MPLCSWSVDEMNRRICNLYTRVYAHFWCLKHVGCTRYGNETSNEDELEMHVVLEQQVGDCKNVMLFGLCKKCLRVRVGFSEKCIFGESDTGSTLKVKSSRNLGKMDKKWCILGNCCIDLSKSPTFWNVLLLISLYLFPLYFLATFFSNFCMVLSGERGKVLLWNWGEQPDARAQDRSALFLMSGMLALFFWYYFCISSGPPLLMGKFKGDCLSGGDWIRHSTRWWYMP